MADGGDELRGSTMIGRETLAFLEKRSRKCGAQQEVIGELRALARELYGKLETHLEDVESLQLWERLEALS